ncbi:fumarylacetoacetate hydrolase family protein [Metabacillus halosaccharovorans]|uniref:fumarylacetoacetate hydrolase family protein n=1 Tax=Metabacillus halosaccharovorans TaxID=930124 RepID=UPI001C1F5396|nr:fumarylacetoacetate hydrolase family protein [Metabacillus halosaccharovorans]MBU7595749.1 fumarylacetoacetate hydrolase family protein [Metabacillus halosaccharovorans]
MKFIRFIDNEGNKPHGIITAGMIEEISGDIFGEWVQTGKTFVESDVKVIAPLEPNQVIGIGANYIADEKDRPEKPQDIPVFFFKPTSSVIGPEEEIRIPESVSEVKFESELAVVIGKEAYQINEDEVLDHIFGYTIANDITSPQYFHKDGHWTIGKSFDTFTPLGPVIETALDPTKVQVEAYLNETKKQDSSTKFMIISLTKMISYLSGIMTLKPGDVILTGSPIGAEFLRPGDKIDCRIKEIGSLFNSVVK